jgi:hypothetical protein
MPGVVYEDDLYRLIDLEAMLAAQPAQGGARRRRFNLFSRRTATHD